MKLKKIRGKHLFTLITWIQTVVEIVEEESSVIIIHVSLMIQSHILSVVKEVNIVMIAEPLELLTQLKYFQRISSNLTKFTSQVCQTLLSAF